LAGEQEARQDRFGNGKADYELETDALAKHKGTIELRG
jgi:hypothetical protein